MPPMAEPLGILLISGTHERAHYAFMLAVGAAAIGRKVVLFATNDGCRALLRDWSSLADAGRDAAVRETGVAGLDELRDAAGELGVPLMACESGLLMAGLRAEALIGRGRGVRHPRLPRRLPRQHDDTLRLLDPAAASAAGRGMRLAVLLLLAMPAYAAAQTAPTGAPPAKPSQKSAPVKPKQNTPAKPAAKSLDQPNRTPKPAAKARPCQAERRPSRARRSRRCQAARPAPVVAPPAPTEAAPTEPNKGSDTGLPLPRYAALRSDDVNFRSGPGTRYPIEWVYKRRDLPVEIEREFEKWRLIKDPQGNKGWVHQATLTGRRTAVVAGAEHVLRQAANDTAGPVATLRAGVILRLRSCEANSQWCQAQIGDYRGFIKRSELWGVMPDEVIQ